MYSEMKIEVSGPGRKEVLPWDMSELCNWGSGLIALFCKIDLTHWD